jgi:methyl-accepting chemotaxis protein
MLSLRKLSVRSRFYLTMALVAVSLIVQAGWGFVSARSAGATVTSMFDQAEVATQQPAILRSGQAGLADIRDGMARDALVAAIARGDLAGPIAAQGSDEPARLMHGLADMQRSLRRLVGQVRESSRSARPRPSRTRASSRSRARAARSTR